MRRRLIRVVGLLAGVGVVAWLLHDLGVEAVMARLRRVGPAFVLMPIAYLAAAFVYGLPFGLLLPRAIRPSILSLFAGRVAAAAINAATPFLGLGGEPARLLWLRPGERRAGLAALVVDRSAYLVSGAITLGTGALVGLPRLPLGPLQRVLVAGFAITAIGLALFMIHVQRRSGLLAPIVGVLGRLLPKRRRDLAAEARVVDGAVRELHLEGSARFWSAVGLHCLARAVAVLEVAAGVHLLDAHVGVTGIIVLATAPLAIDLLFAMVPSQIGFHEGANAVLMGALGGEPAAGVALAFLQRLRQVVTVALGFALLSLRREKGGGPRGSGAPAPLQARSVFP